MQIAKKDLFEFLEVQEQELTTFESYKRHAYHPTLTEEKWDHLYANREKINAICIGQEMSTGDLGGDDIVKLAEDVIKATTDGWEVIAWYGPAAQVLVAGVKELEIGD